MIAVMASGQGSNFEILAKNFPSLISFLICNVPQAKVLQISEKYSIPSVLLDHKAFKNRQEQEKAVLESLRQIPHLKLIVLAGYMRVLSPFFFQELKFLQSNRRLSQQLQIINLHPAHLDEYKGAHAYEHALQFKYPRWGLSVHHVTEMLDSGALIESLEFPIFPYEEIEHLKAKARKLEHELLVKAVHKIIIHSFKNNFTQTISERTAP